MDFINKVELSGNITEIRKSEKGTNFIMLRQMIKYNDTEHPRLFELFVNADRTDIIEKLAIGKDVRIQGVLTIFRIKKFNIQKMIVEIGQLDIIE
jgi:hypothetical protein